MTNFHNYLKDNNLSEATIRSYVLDVEACIKFKIIDKNLSFFNLKLLNQKFKPATIRRRVASIKKYAKYLRSIGASPIKIEDTNLPKVVQNIPNVLTKEEALALIESCKNTEIKLALSILYSTGCRISSLAGVEIEDIKDNTIIFKTAKGDKPYIGVIGETTQELYKKFVGNRKSGYLFCNSFGERITPNALRNKIRKEMGDKYVNPHLWRHSIATELVSGGVGLLTVQTMLNHSSVSTTQKYVHLSSQTHIRELKKGHPMLSD